MEILTRLIPKGALSCLILFCLMSASLLAAEPGLMAAETNRVFQNQEIKVVFPESGYAAKSVTPKAGAAYFARYLTHLKFCKQPQQPPHVQQVRSEDGWLCSFYILPPLAKEQLKTEILKQQGPHQTLTYQKKPGIGEERHRDRPMLVWRMQSGKTRLDHFLLIGPQHNYLFVSSPYGDGEMTRKTVETLEFL